MFSLGLHLKDEVILKDIQNIFQGGNTYKLKADLVQLRIFSVKDLLKVFNHFDQYPLLTQKQADYELFKQALNLIITKEHLTKEGLTKIVAIKEYLNKGLSVAEGSEIKSNFTEGITPIVRPFIVQRSIKDPN